MTTRRPVSLVAAIALAMGPILANLASDPGGVSAASPVAAASIKLVPVLAGLDNPVFVTNARDGSNRLFVVEQGGMIKVLLPGETTPTVFLDLTAKVLLGSEQGLLGLTFHPQFSSSRRFFVDYTRQSDGATVIAQYQASLGDPNVADPTETVLLVIPQPFANHNGGMVEFGPEGLLYIGMGDGGSANDPGNRAQDTTQLLGKILRIDVDHPDGAQPYSSPPSNPFFGADPGRDEIYAYGLRNPWRFSFDRGTGQLYAGDVGQDQIEEIDVVTSGGNYGWRIWEGTQCTNNDPGQCNPAGFVFPITEYNHTRGRCAVIGGYVYRGAQASLSTGSYVYGDECTGEIFLFANQASIVALDTGFTISSFGEDESGEIYVVNLGGTVSRIAQGVICLASLTPVFKVFSRNGGSGSVTVTVPTGCDWTAMSNVDWITITAGGSGTGSGTVSYSVDVNSGRVRRGTLTIAGRTFTVLSL